MCLKIWREGRTVKSARSGETVDVVFSRERSDFGELKANERLWKTDDPLLNRRLRKSFDRRHSRRRVALDLRVVAQKGKPLRVTARSATGIQCQLESDDALQEARQHPVTESQLREQFGRLGAYAFQTP